MTCTMRMRTESSADRQAGGSEPLPGASPGQRPHNHEDNMSNETISIRMSKDKWSIKVIVGGAEIAEYRAGKNINAEISALRRAIKKHLAKPGATINNYQW